MVTKRGVNRLLFVLPLLALPLWYMYRQSGFWEGFIRHTHGGFVSGYFSYYIFRRTPLNIGVCRKFIGEYFEIKILIKIKKEKKISREIIIYGLFVISAGVGVEIFEFIAVNYGGQNWRWDIVDSMYDILADILGGSLTYLVFLRNDLKKLSNKK